MKKKPLSIVVIILASILIYFGYNIDLDSIDIKDYMESVDSTNKSNTSNQDTISKEDSVQNSNYTHYSFRSQELYQSHYEKHKDEFGNITMEEYLSGANNLINQVSSSIIIKEDEDGDLMFFDTSTDEFGILSIDGFIRTYFIPEDGIDYFNRK